MVENDFIDMLMWLGELIIASWALSYGAEHLSVKYGAKFIGRTVLSIATTLPEIAIVAYAAVAGNYGIAIGAGLGSNLLMMTLGLSIMLIIATTRLSKAPLRSLDVSSFRLDKLFLLITAIVSAVLFIDGYNYFDGFIFVGMFVAYFIMAVREMKVDKNKELLSSMPNNNNELTRQKKNEYKNNDKDGQISEATTTTTSTACKSEPDLINATENFQNVSKAHNGRLIKALLIFMAGIVGILIGAEPFIHSLEGFSVDIGISAIVLSVIISPIAGEMPEKLSLMILARKGAHGASIAISNVLGSKILNNTLLLAIAVFGAIYHGGLYTTIGANILLSYQMVLVTIITIAALIPMLKREIGLRVGMMLLGLYVTSLVIQFFLPHQTHT